MNTTVEEIKETTLNKMNEYNKSHDARGRFSSGGSGGGGGVSAKVTKGVGTDIGLKGVGGKGLKMGDKVTMAGSNKKGSYIVVGKTSQGHALVLSSGGEAGRTSSASASSLTHTGKRNKYYARRPVAIDSMDRTKSNMW